MNGSEIAREIAQRQNDSLCFIRWFRKENDFVDYELTERFLRTASVEKEYAGYELLDMEQMWAHVKNLAPKHLHRESRTRGGEVIVWERPEVQGSERTQTCPFIPDSLMTIFNVLTKGNVVDA